MISKLVLLGVVTPSSPSKWRMENDKLVRVWRSQWTPTMDKEGVTLLKTIWRIRVENWRPTFDIEHMMNSKVLCNVECRIYLNKEVFTLPIIHL